MTAPQEPPRDEAARDYPVRDDPVRDSPASDDPVRDSPVRDDAVRLAELVAQRVAAGSADGTYPPGIDDDLDGHWRRVVSRPADAPLDRVHRGFENYMAGATFHVPTVAPSSGLPGGALVHKVVGATVTRHLQELVLQLDDFSRHVQEMFAAIVAVIDVPTHTHTQLVGHLESMEGRLVELMRAANAVAASSVADAGTIGTIGAVQGEHPDGS
jgi:hypothetical protein